MEAVQDVRLVAGSLIAWLTWPEAQRMLVLMNQERFDDAEALIVSRFGEIPAELNMDDEDVREALLDSLGFRISPIIKDPDKVVTQPIPQYDRFATDHRAA